MALMMIIALSRSPKGATQAPIFALTSVQGIWGED